MEEIEKKLTDLDYDFDFTVFNDFNSKLELIRIKLRELYKQYNTDSKAKIIELNSELLKLQYVEK